MKRKLTILLSSVLASALLVGGSFATYFAVTDNADPEGRNVTPGSLDDDDTTYVTLNWGATKSLDNIENLKVGENRKLGVVGLSSTLAAGYQGLFTVSLTDKTVRTAAQAENKKLIDYLTVTVYDGEANLVAPELEAEATDLPEGALTPRGESTAYHRVYDAVGAVEEHKYTVFVTYKAEATLYSSQMQNDRVYIEVDWAPAAGDAATSRAVYYKNTNKWAKVYAYYWVGETNNKFPGTEMDYYGLDADGVTKVYATTVPVNMENIIFNAGDGNDEHKTGNIPFTGYSATTPYYTGAAWGALTLEEAEPEEVEYNSYKLVLGDWATAGAEIFVHSWGAKDRDYKVTDQKVLQLPKDATGFVLVRMQNGAEAIDYDNAWNKSADMVPGAEGKVLVFSDWGTEESTFNWVNANEKINLYARGETFGEDWEASATYQFTYSAEENYVAELKNLELTAFKKFKFADADWAKSYTKTGIQRSGQEFEVVENLFTGTAVDKLTVYQEDTDKNTQATETITVNVFYTYEDTFVINLVA